MRYARFIAVTAAVSAVLAPLSAAAAPSFWDVVSTRYAQAYSYLGDRGAIEGYADESGRPGQQLSRAEALKIIVSLHPKYRERAQWFALHMPSIPLFWDTDQNAWYGPYIETAFEAGLITGYPDRSFRPASTLNAEEGITLLLRSYGMSSIEDAGTWYESAVAAAFKMNIISSQEPLYLGYPLTRGQFIDMAYRTDVVWSGKLVAFAETNVRPTVTMTTTVQLPSLPSTGGVTPSAKTFAITIPTLGITDLTVTHPADPTSSEGLLSVLGSGVGHLFSYPGGDGKIMIYGHSSGYPWDVSKYTQIFRRVSEMQQGDRVYVTYQGKLYAYEVTRKQTVPADDMSSFSGQGEELILYTCWPPDSIKERYLVHASPVRSMALR